MPVDRTRKNHICHNPGCQKAFSRPYDLDRHERTHLGYHLRPFGCSFPGCTFRANQDGGVVNHFGSVHAGLRIPCGEPNCTQTFSDPSSRSKHKTNIHRGGMTKKGKRSQVRKRPRKKKHSPAGPVSVPARVARHIQEHSGEDAKDILDQFATFVIEASNEAFPTSGDPPSVPDTRPPTSHAVLSSTFVFRPNYTMQPSHCEHPGVFHRANDVPTDGWSFDKPTKLEHQRVDANPQSPPTAWGYHPDAPVVSRPPLPFHHLYQPSQPELTQGDSQTVHNESCTCLDCTFRDLTLAPLVQYEERQRAPLPNEARIPFSSPGMGHVAPSDHQWKLPPNDVWASSAYFRPNPRMLFDR